MDTDEIANTMSYIHREIAYREIAEKSHNDKEIAYNQFKYVHCSIQVLLKKYKADFNAFNADIKNVKYVQYFEELLSNARATESNYFQKQIEVYVIKAANGTLNHINEPKNMYKYFDLYILKKCLELTNADVYSNLYNKNDDFIINLVRGK